ncbi:MAG TPA: hydroxymethylbilane synthase, partial [Blastocatellia bacterium]
RGNVDTRLRKLDDGDFDAIILAAAGLHRLGFTERITEHLNTQLVLPAVGQGALAIETRSDDAEVNELIGRLDHEPTRLACQAERAFLKGLGGGCLVPIAAHARIESPRLELTGLVASTDGREIVRGTVAGSSEDAEALGNQLARALIAQGADQILARG